MDCPRRAAARPAQDWRALHSLRGDRAWDIAGALRDFIFFWVISMPHGLPPEEMAAGARFPLDVPGVAAARASFQPDLIPRGDASIPALHNRDFTIRD